MSEIKAIETRYKGYRFRSRLEARWAVFFDALGVKWDYEPEGFDVGGRPYLPDFHLPGLDVYAEIKGTVEAARENDALFNTFSETVDPIIVLVGVPFENFGLLYSLDVTCSSGGHADFDALIDSDKTGGRIHFVSQAHSDCRTLYTTDWKPLRAIAYPDHKTIQPSASFWSAQAAARAARFEHGETPR